MVSKFKSSKIESSASLRSLVKDARANGIKVSYRVRKDGGILIKSIDGRKYGGAMGNRALRDIFGLELSQKQLRANRKLVARYIEKKPITELKGKKLVERVQRDWSIYKPNVSGKITFEKYEYTRKHHGEAEAIRRMIEADKYARGIAYEKNVDLLIAKMENFRDSLDSSAKEERMNRIIDRVRGDKDNIIQRDLEEAMNVIYSGGDDETIIKALENLFI